MNSINFLNLAPHELAQELKKKQIERFAFIFDSKTKQLESSHPELKPIAEAISKNARDFHSHEGLFFQVSKHANSILGAFVHSTQRGQAQGGTRFWSYSNFEDYLNDGLRLSLGMTRKNALAGLWWGGGKGVISRDPSSDLKDSIFRQKLFNEYGEFVSSLAGCYITAKDVGTTDEDIASIFARTRFVTCIPPQYGGSGSPSKATALGVVRGMQAALDFQNKGSLQGKTIAIQGAGNVAEYLVDYLLRENVRHIQLCDISKETVERFKSLFPGKPIDCQVVSPEDLSLLAAKVDILAPCATGATLNPKTIPSIQAPIVCGAANNQLEDPIRDDLALYNKGTVYMPDYVVNRMGIVNCANEQYGYVDSDQLAKRHLDKEWEHSVYQMSLKVLKRCQSSKKPAGICANEIADEMATIAHPFLGHRGIQIIQTLKARNWYSR
jgi:leucine dehydrogenase